LRFKWDQFRRLRREGSENFVRGRKEKTIQNIEMRRKTETKLEEKKLDWLEFLKIVSHTNVPLTQDLEQQYKENGNEVYDGEDLDFDENDDGEGTCIKCQLKIYEKNMFQPCGDTNVCQECIDDIMESNNPKCPNKDCSKTIEKVLPFRK
jgi:hypothetical protein